MVMGQMMMMTIKLVPQHEGEPSKSKWLLARWWWWWLVPLVPLLTMMMMMMMWMMVMMILNDDLWSEGTNGKMM